jgi:hypothetical protein
MDLIKFQKIRNISKKIHEGDIITPKEWENAAWEMNDLKGELAKEFNSKKRQLAVKRVEITRAQEKKNVALANIEIEALPEYEDLKNIESQIDFLEEAVRIAKKQSDTF